MITIEKIPEKELQLLRKKIEGNYWGIACTMAVVTVVLGFFFDQWIVTLVTVGLIFFIFYLAKATGSKSPITGDTKIIRLNKAVDVKLVRVRGYRTRYTTIDIILDKDEIPKTYFQGDKFTAYNSFGGHLAELKGVTEYNYKGLIGKEVQITYMAINGFVIDLKIP